LGGASDEKKVPDAGCGVYMTLYKSSFKEREVVLIEIKSGHTLVTNVRAC
jgi:hypothetical protein